MYGWLLLERRKKVFWLLWQLCCHFPLISAVSSTFLCLQSAWHNFHFVFLYWSTQVMCFHLQNIQSTNWQSMRFKPPPPNSKIGWRVEFRPLNVSTLISWYAFWHKILYVVWFANLTQGHLWRLYTVEGQKPSFLLLLSCKSLSLVLEPRNRTCNYRI